MTWKNLEVILGVSKQWIVEHRKKPASPGDVKDVEAWKAYANQVQANRTGGRHIKTHAGVTIDAHAKLEALATEEDKTYTNEDILQLNAQLKKWQGENEQAKTQIALLRLEREQKELVPAEEAKAAISAVLTPLLRALDTMPRTLSHRVNPIDAQLAEVVMREHIDHIKRGISEIEL